MVVGAGGHRGNVFMVSGALAPEGVVAGEGSHGGGVTFKISWTEYVLRLAQYRTETGEIQKVYLSFNSEAAVEVVYANGDITGRTFQSG